MKISTLKYFVFLLSSSFFVLGCNHNLHLVDSTSENRIAETSISTNSSSDSILSPYKKTLDSSMNAVLNTSLTEMEVGQPEGKLGNFITDLTLSTARKNSESPVDFCVLNNGGLRVPLPKGDITLRKIYELMPFENEIVIVTLKGEQILEMLEYIKDKTLLPPSRKSGVPVSGIRIMLSNNQVKQVFIGMYEFNPDKTYRIATSDYLANGGDHMDFFKTNEGIEKTGIKLRDAIIDYILVLKQKGIAINAALDGRIYHAE